MMSTGLAHRLKQTLEHQQLTNLIKRVIVWAKEYFEVVQGRELPQQHQEDFN